MYHPHWWKQKSSEWEAADTGQTGWGFHRSQGGAQLPLKSNTTWAVNSLCAFGSPPSRSTATPLEETKSHHCVGLREVLHLRWNQLKNSLRLEV